MKNKELSIQMSPVIATAAANPPLISVKGAVFGKTYDDRKVEYHPYVFEVSHDVLIPNACHTECKALFASVEPAFVIHSQHAALNQAMFA